jgi:hypothetical protein
MPIRNGAVVTASAIAASRTAPPVWSSAASPARWSAARSTPAVTAPPAPLGAAAGALAGREIERSSSNNGRRCR